MCPSPFVCNKWSLGIANPCQKLPTLTVTYILASINDDALIRYSRKVKLFYVNELFILYLFCYAHYYISSQASVNLLHYLRLSKAKQITPARPCSPLDFSRCETLGHFFVCTLYWLAPEYHILFSVKVAYHGGRPVCRGHLDLLEAWQLRRGDGRLGRGEPRDVIQVGLLFFSLSQMDT